MAILIFLTPVAAIFLFLNIISLIKKIKSGSNDTFDNTFWGSIMFGYLVLIYYLALVDFF